MDGLGVHKLLLDFFWFSFSFFFYFFLLLIVRLLVGYVSYNRYHTGSIILVSMNEWMNNKPPLAKMARRYTRNYQLLLPPFFFFDPSDIPLTSCAYFLSMISVLFFFSFLSLCPRYIQYSNKPLDVQYHRKHPKLNPPTFERKWGKKRKTPL